MILVTVGIIAAFAKSVTGMGFPLLLIPALAMFMDVADAIVIVAPANLYLNGSLIWETRADPHETVGLRSFLIGSIVGGGLGGLLLPSLPDVALRWILIVIVAVFLANRLRSPDWAIDRSQARRLSPIVGTVSGVFQGAAGISGPIVVPWFLSLRLPRHSFVMSTAAAFGLSGAAQVVSLATQGVFTVELLALGFVLIVAALVVFPLGIRARRLLPAAAFERLVIGLLVISAVSMMARTL